MATVDSTCAGATAEACNEKKIDSKVKYLAGTAATGPAKLKVPEAILPPESSGDDIEVR